MLMRPCQRTQDQEPIQGLEV